MKKTKLFSKLAEDLEQKIRENSHTRGLRVKVECTNGIIKVLGIAKSYFQKQQIINIAVKTRGTAQIEIQDGVKVN